MNCGIAEILEATTLDWGVADTSVEFKDNQLPESMKRVLAPQGGGRT